MAPFCLLCLVLSLLPILAKSITDPGDYAILLAFQSSLDNPEILKWPSDNKDPCGPPKWPHVFCQGNRVSQIQLQNLGVSGTLPANFTQLSMLSNLGFQNNKFRGTLPSFRGLTNLQYAFLNGNQFDTIPSDFFGGLTSLLDMSLDENPLNKTTGGWTLPADLADSSALVNLTLVNCGLVGPIPDFLGELSNLDMLQLSYNNLTGMIPSSFSGSNIKVLWLNNQAASGLTGPIDVITQMPFLTDVWLHGNSFTGPIPDSIGALTALTRIWLNNNQFVGLIPSNLTSLPSLQDLKLDNNLLMGPIPSVKYNFTFSDNSFCASDQGVPCRDDVTALLGFLHGLNYPAQLDSSWSGNDPCVGDWRGIICSSGKVVAINLPNLRLNGTISPSIGNLAGLIDIKLGGNNLTGQIPANLTNLKSLKFVNVSSNNLAPPVPSFPNGVTLLLANNPLIDKTASPNTDPSTTPGIQNSSPSNGKAGNENQRTSKKSNVSVIIIPMVAAGLIAISLVGFLFYYKGKRRKASALMPVTSVVVHPRDSSDPGSNSLKLVVANGSNANTPRSESSGNSNVHVIEAGNFIISVQVLRNATKNFSEKNVLGRGGFGTVYKGELHDGTMIAVKRMEASVVTNKALDEFQAEIAMLTKVRHRNLVSILGFSMEGPERLLVYEYMPQGALSKHLFHWKQFELNPLSWKRRLNIALDVARGMEYLHNLGQQCFIHRDLKSANILLGDDFRAKVSDFGLVKLAPDGKYSVATRLAGTFGYLAPEYAVTGKITTKADVFSYGVVLMELLTGMTALDESRVEETRYLASWFTQIRTDKQKLKDSIDPSLDTSDEETFASICTVAELAGHCAAREPYQRPDMSHAVTVLVPLVEKWKPAKDESEEYMGIDLHLPLLQMVKGWQDADVSGTTASTDMSGTCSIVSLADSKGSIPSRPAGFAESFTSADGR
ncbi:Receptor-like protein kinase-like protein [Rhynchospora pubera]|uniref:non-specific serine/threonine protein kinase n=1 Tax=Rhynchospora pubera TaxID=906938 RepID=A0AAV8DSI8_9POAL|nr:Receptor-like protein kinase-like protein [Rhynchospora pubera]